MTSSNVQEWKPVEGSLMTRWAKDVHPEHVLTDYPRPQMVRENWMNLNGLWDYAIRPREEQSCAAYEGKILVPFPIESSLSGVKRPLKPEECLWYRRTFIIEKEWREQKLLLHFGAVDWQMEVWINNERAGEHSGGYYPFSFDITDYISEGANELVVRVWDPTQTYGQERGKQTLNPQGLFYTAVSGIWQTVWIEPVPVTFIKSFKLTPDIDSEVLQIELHAEGAGANRDLQFEVTVYVQGDLKSEAVCGIDETMKLSMVNPKLWSPDTPFLYDLQIRLLDQGQLVDQVSSYTGMRKFSIEQGKDGIKRLCLNHQPLFQHGILDQGYWPDGLYTAPTDEALEYDVRTAKELGFNMIRKHIKTEPARWYYHCDRIGVIVWQDMINGGGGFNLLHHFILPNFFGSIPIKDNKYKAFGRECEENRRRYRKELKEMVDALYNVPSIGMWVPFNEAWGQFDAAETLEWLQAYDPTRWIDHASGWHDQDVGDIRSVHTYIRKLKMPKRIHNRAVVISEYGGYSLQEKGHVWHEDKHFGYKRCKTKQALSDAYAVLMDKQLKPLIPQGVSAAVYTQLTDVESELNGILTYDREVIKIDPELLKSLHQDLIDASLLKLHL